MKQRQMIENWQRISSCVQSEGGVRVKRVVFVRAVHVLRVGE